MTEENKKHKLYITYSQRETGGDSLDPDEQWSSREDLHIDVRWKGAFLDHPDTYQVEEIEVDFDPSKVDHIYLLTVIYESGNTFGRSYGNWAIIGVYKTAEEALKIKKDIESDNEYFDNKYTKKTGYKEKYKNYKPWVGYFERFTSSELEILSVIGEKNND